MASTPEGRGSGRLRFTDSLAGSPQGSGLASRSVSGIIGQRKAYLVLRKHQGMSRCGRPGPTSLSWKRLAGAEREWASFLSVTEALARLLAFLLVFYGDSHRAVPIFLQVVGRSWIFSLTFVDNSGCHIMHTEIRAEREWELPNILLLTFHMHWTISDPIPQTSLLNIWSLLGLNKTQRL